jgi:hypothetical protein
VTSACWPVSGLSIARGSPSTVTTILSPAAARFTWLLRSCLSSLIPIRFMARVYTAVHTPSSGLSARRDQLEEPLLLPAEVFFSDLLALEEDPDEESEEPDEPESEDPDEDESEPEEPDEPSDCLAAAAACLALFAERVP